MYKLLNFKILKYNSYHVILGDWSLFVIFLFLPQPQITLFIYLLIIQQGE